MPEASTLAEILPPLKAELVRITDDLSRRQHMEEVVCLVYRSGRYLFETPYGTISVFSPPPLDASPFSELDFSDPDIQALVEEAGQYLREMHDNGEWNRPLQGESFQRQQPTPWRPPPVSDEGKEAIRLARAWAGHHHDEPNGRALARIVDIIAAYQDCPRIGFLCPWVEHERRARKKITYVELGDALQELVAMERTLPGTCLATMPTETGTVAGASTSKIPATKRRIAGRPSTIQRRPGENYLKLLKALLGAQRPLPDHGIAAAADDMSIGSARRPLQRMRKDKHLRECEGGWCLSKRGKKYAQKTLKKWE